MVGKLSGRSSWSCLGDEVLEVHAVDVGTDGTLQLEMLVDIPDCLTCQAEELLRREPTDCKPRLVLNVPDGTDFFDIKPEDFELVDYDSVKPQLKFDLAI